MDADTNSFDALIPSTESEAALLASVASGDQQALAHLFQRHSQLVYSIALQVLRDPAGAEDVMQEVFIQIWRSPTFFIATRGSLRGWLAAVARNRAIDIIRRRRLVTPLDDVSLISSSNVFSEVQHHVLVERARVLISKLPTEQRDALELAFFEGLTHAEIAEKLSHPLGTVKTRIRSGLQSLAKAMRV